MLKNTVKEFQKKMHSPLANSANTLTMSTKISEKSYITPETCITHCFLSIYNLKIFSTIVYSNISDYSMPRKILEEMLNYIYG